MRAKLKKRKQIFTLFVTEHESTIQKHTHRIKRNNLTHSLV